MRARLRAYAEIAKWPVLWLVWAAAGLACLRLLAAPAHGGACSSPYCDFSAFWEAGRLARAGHAAESYDVRSFLAWRQAWLGAAAGPLTWYYPPTALLPLLPVAGLALGRGFALWTAGLAVFAAGVARAGGLRWAAITVGLLSPAALWNMELGQFGGVAGAALVTALSAARPLPAGLALGLLTIKPQAALVVPFAWVSAGRWRAAAVAVVVVLLWLAASLTLFGLSGWQAYLTEGLAQSRAMLVQLSTVSGSAAFGVSVFGMLRSAGASVGVAGGVQALATLSALAGAAWLWRRGAARRVLCTAILALLATPYGYVDDMVGVSLALAMVVQASGWRFSLTDALLFTWPVLGPVVYGATGLQVTPLLLCLALWRSGAGSRPETAPGSADRPADAPAAGRT